MTNLNKLPNHVSVKSNPIQANRTPVTANYQLTSTQIKYAYAELMGHKLESNVNYLLDATGTSKDSLTSVHLMCAITDLITEFGLCKVREKIAESGDSWSIKQGHTKPGYICNRAQSSDLQACRVLLDS